MSQINKIITIKFAASPTLFSTKNYKEKIVEDIKNRYTDKFYDNEYIVEILNVYTDYIRNPIIDPISGNMQLNVNVKCVCVSVKVNDELTITITKIIDRGVMGICKYDMINAVVTQQYLSDWTYKDKYWENSDRKKIELGSVIKVKIVSWRYEKNTLRCFAKLIS